MGNSLLNNGTTSLMDSTKSQNSLRSDSNLYCYPAPDDYMFPLQVLGCFVNPLLSLVGLFINVLCLVILVKVGLKKTTYILLFALVMSDSLNMFENLDFGNKIRIFGTLKSKPGYCTFEYESEMNQFLYVSQQLFGFVGLWGRTINTSIPMIITIKRILAVYFPCRSSTGGSLTSNYSGKVVANVASSDFLVKNFSVLNTFTVYALETLASFVPTCFMCLGCILIGIKVSVSVSQRRKLTREKKKQKWSPRTTRTLLITCLIFAITHAITSLISAIASVSTQAPLLTYRLVEISAFFNISSCTQQFLRVLRL
ncbi:G-protein coupled receptor [Biomphalaria pfeifferi]|uniref:G-protein coupled receptor n=1 Tax=Biomphalaria pfeifferi TaxID=112525 RepID=A0AAD8EZH9_BIOPF|nr:G-protein coupled receptor [Biomphalaria pfeifferi]